MQISQIAQSRPFTRHKGLMTVVRGHFAQGHEAHRGPGETFFLLPWPPEPLASNRNETKMEFASVGELKVYKWKDFTEI